MQYTIKGNSLMVEGHLIWLREDDEPDLRPNVRVEEPPVQGKEYRKARAIARYRRIR